MEKAQEYVHLTDEQFLDAAVGILSKAREGGVALRILGSLGIYAHSKHAPECLELFHALGRIEPGSPLFTDLDLAGYAKQSPAISRLFDGLGFQADKMVNGFFGDRRLIYYEGSGRFHVDVFLDKLEFSHDVEFGSKPGQGRLELDFPTIPLADIVLEKLQIHAIGRKDLVDLIVLFLGHDVAAQGPASAEAVDGSYIAGLLADDWGFWYESTLNLAKTRQLLETFVAAGSVVPGAAAVVRERLGKLERLLADVPKSRKWEKRARTGAAKPWFREVEEVVR